MKRLGSLKMTCDPHIGCKSVSELRGMHIAACERMNATTDRGERLVESFEKCLESIEYHTLKLNDGKHVMAAMDKDITGLGARLTLTKRQLWIAYGCLGSAVAVLYGVILLSPAHEYLLKSFRILG